MLRVPCCGNDEDEIEEDDVFVVDVGDEPELPDSVNLSV